MHDADTLVERLHAGDDSAFDDVFQEYFTRLIRLAKGKLTSLPPQIADDEGAVISAFRSFFSGINKGQFDQIVDRHELWKVLAIITVRKSIAQLRRHFKKSGEANLMDRTVTLELLRNSEPTSESVVEMVDQCDFLLSQISDETVRSIAILRLQGYESSEIAQQVDLHQRSVQRKIALIAAQWEELNQDGTVS